MTVVNEQHYTPKELAQKWHLSATTIRRWCDEHGGVLFLNRAEMMNKRCYRTIRIPQSTADEIYRRHFLPLAQRNKVRHWSEAAPFGGQMDDKLDARPTVRPAPTLPAPEVTIFTRHRRDCKHRRDALFQSCDCPKSFSFRDLGMLLTLRSGTHSWKEAEELKQKAIGLVVRGERSDVSSAITDVRSRMLLSLAEAAIDLGCTEEELRQMIRRNGLPVVRFGRYAYLIRSDLIFIKRSGSKNIESHRRS